MTFRAHLIGYGYLNISILFPNTWRLLANLTIALFIFWPFLYSWLWIKKKNIWSFSNILSRKTNSEWISDTHGARLTISSEAWQELFTSHRGDKGLRSRIQHKELSEFNEKVNPQKTEKWFQLTLHQIMKYRSTNNDLQIDKTVWIYFQYILLGQIKPVGAHLAEILEKSES